MAEIDDYYDLIMGRRPAGEITDPNAVLNPLGAQMPQKEPVTEADISILKRTPSVKFPIADTFKENIESSILGREDIARELRQQMAEPRAQSAARIAQAEKTLGELSASRPLYTPNAEIEAQLEKSRAAAEAPVDQSRDLVSELILSFGPSVLGAFTGEAGKLAQLKSGQESRAMFESRRKESIEMAKASRDNAQKRHDALLKIKQSDRESWDKSQQRELDKLKGVLSAQVDFAKMSEDRANKLADQYNKAVEGASQATEKAAKDLSDLEKFPQEQAAKEQRAKILASQAQQKLNTPTEGERKGAFQLGLMRQAEQNINDLKQKYGGYPSVNNKWFRLQKNIASGMFGTTLVSDALNSSAIDPAVREQISAELQFLESIGRIQSGAAISMSEWNSMREQYFPTFGDSPDSIARKEQQRKKALEGLGIVAGRAESMVAPPKSISADQVKVSNGKETLIIDRSDLKDANKDGYKEVK